MAQINITLNQEEILEILSKNRDEAFKTVSYTHLAVYKRQILCHMPSRLLRISTSKV